MAKKNNPAVFETDMQQLETLVETLENGDLSLEQALQAFEQGVTLTRRCQNTLDAAEQKVKILLQTDDAITVEDFAVPEKND